MEKKLLGSKLIHASKMTLNYCAQIVCMQWLKKEFLPYLEDWEKSVRKREGFTDAQKKRMLGLL